MVFHLTEARIGAEGNERTTEVHRSARSNNKDKFDKESFQFYENEISFGRVLHWTNPTDIPQSHAQINDATCDTIDS
jgi:hypothetical protein